MDYNGVISNMDVSLLVSFFVSLFRHQHGILLRELSLRQKFFFCLSWNELIWEKMDKSYIGFVVSLHCLCIVSLFISCLSICLTIAGYCLFFCQNLLSTCSHHRSHRVLLLQWLGGSLVQLMQFNLHEMYTFVVKCCSRHLQSQLLPHRCVLVIQSLRGSLWLNLPWGVHICMHEYQGLRNLLCKCFCVPVCYPVFCHYVQQRNSDTTVLLAVTTSFSKDSFLKLPHSKVMAWKANKLICSEYGYYRWLTGAAIHR